jgi:membrane-associated phospholipid phosphatase
LDDDVKLFFGCAQAVHDAGIACWDVKRVYDSVRPITAVPYYLHGQAITAWAGYNQGVRPMLADDWYPYQPPTVRTPSFPEFPSGHSTFSAAAAAVLAGLRGSDRVNIRGSVAAGAISFETNVPARTQNFVFPSLSNVAAAAGLSRRQCGIHFEQGDLAGRALGAQVGSVVLRKCNALFRGRG